LASAKVPPTGPGIRGVSSALANQGSHRKSARGNHNKNNKE
jgi:hypothetical protein